MNLPAAELCVKELTLLWGSCCVAADLRGLVSWCILVETAKSLVLQLLAKLGREDSTPPCRGGLNCQPFLPHFNSAAWGILQAAASIYMKAQLRGTHPRVGAVSNFHCAWSTFCHHTRNLEVPPRAWRW